MYCISRRGIAGRPSEECAQVWMCPRPCRRRITVALDGTVTVLFPGRVTAIHTGVALDGHGPDIVFAPTAANWPSWPQQGSDGDHMAAGASRQHLRGSGGSTSPASGLFLTVSVMVPVLRRDGFLGPPGVPSARQGRRLTESGYDTPGVSSITPCDLRVLARPTAQMPD